MKFLRYNSCGDLLDRDTVAAVGNFDGVHRGHQALLQQLIQRADAMKLPSLVILFEPQPSEFFLKDQAPARLTRLHEKLEQFKKLGIDYVCCLRFNPSMAKMTADAFATQVLFSRLRVRHLLVGHDFRFGHERQGTPELLRVLGQKTSTTIECYPDFFIDHDRVSSTLIRKRLYEGNFKAAEEMLGRPFSISGRVVHGEALGREWGVPTANINIFHVVPPVHGIFCVEVKREGVPPKPGVASLGCRPTLEGTENKLEVFLFDFNESIYGEKIQVYFLHKLREEVKFSSLEALIEQIHLDIAMAKRYFEHHAFNAV